jgi:anthranilate synthase component 1
MRTEAARQAGSREISHLLVSPGREEFEALEGYTHAIVFTGLSCDLETPVSTFMKLRAAPDEPCFMLESAESGRMWGRYSFLGFAPSAVASVDCGSLVVTMPGGEIVIADEDPVEALFSMVDGARVFVSGGADEVEEAPPFEGGAVGFFGYGTLGLVEKVMLAKEAGVGGIPELMFMFPGRLVVFDHLRSRLRLSVLVDLRRAGEERGRAYDAAVDELEEMASSVRDQLPRGGSISIDTNTQDDFSGVNGNVTRQRFEEMVREALEHIFAGDAFQVVVSQRLSMPFDGDPLSVYRHLRAENPSPYMFYLQMPGVTLVGSSPEPMVTNLKGRAVIRPIAGTRPRGAGAEADAALASELEGDAKEKAEHIMLVDLARNDLGRVSRPGTVKVTRLMEVERYSHVMHMVSEVEGVLEDGAGNCELLKASFPAGTVVGAPKVRAAEIVEALEPDGRGPYAGAVGYLSYSGDMDTCITIRTVVIRDGTAHVQAGAGVVADSDPAHEYQETLDKARAVVRAVRAAGRAGRDG